MPLTIPTWVPVPARNRLDQLRATPLGQDERGAKLLERLATYEAMRTDVWEKLPSNSGIDPGQIIEVTFFAFTILPMLPRPFPKKGGKRAWAQWGAHREKHEPLTDPEHLSSMAASLREAIFKAKGETERYWSQFWNGDKAVTPESILSLLDELHAFYSKMHVEYQELLSSLPAINRWNGKAEQKFLSDHLSKRITQTYERPMDSLVAALVGVAFDLKNPTAPETIRGRRRLAAPEKLARKSR